MRIHKLRLRGVGPFTDEFTIDFDAIGARKLFLIDGVTGAGKSTIIDAIVFALYGYNSEASAKSRMVSHFIGGGITKQTRPFVELVFSVESGVYRVFREPEYDYINRNGNPDTQNPTVRVERLASEVAEHGEVIANRIQEGTREIEAKIGLDASQFHATIVLAQGKFARFLKATSQERQDILEKVFGTQGYTKAQQFLEAEAKNARTQRKNQEIELRDAVSRFLQVAEIEDAEGSWPQLVLDNPDEALSLARHEVQRFSGRADDATKETEAASALRNEALVAEQQAQSLAQKVARKAALLSRAAQLSDESADIERQRALLDRDAQSRAVDPALKAWQRAQQAVEAAERAWDSAKIRLPATDAPLLDMSDNALRSALHNSRTEIAQTIGSLDAAVDTERKVLDFRQAIAAYQKQVVTAKAQVNRLDVRRQELPVEIKDLRARLESASATAQRISDLNDELDGCRDGAEAAALVSELKSSRRAARRAAEGAQAHLEKVTAEVAQVERAFNSSLAAQVALVLEPGRPCPACGSLEHPAPAPTTDVVDETHVQLARDEVERARKSLTTAGTDLGGVEIALATAKANAKDLSEEQWAAKITNLEQQLASARRAQQESDTLADQLRALEQEYQQLDDQHTDAVTAHERAVTTTENALPTLAEAESVVKSARGDFESVAARVESLQQRREALDDFEEVRQARESARTRSDQAEAGLQAALQDNDFVDRGECLAARLDDRQVQQWSDAVRRHDDDQVSVKSALADPDMAGVDPDLVVDVDEPAQRRQEADDTYEVAVGKAQTAQEAARHVRHSHAALADSIDAFSKVSEATAAIIRMADFANGSGSNRRGIPLATYVILRRFEEVVAAANERLHAISDGRYGLQTDVERRDGRRIARGLGLSIVDRETDKLRGVDTLSGGETFYTSLSLALGLADVVQAEAGGIQLGTLFIDEGFGSLDGDTLDAVMNVLHQLTRGDRVVGVISHVEEMKRAIPDRIHVQRQADGTSIIRVPD